MSFVLIPPQRDAPSRSQAHGRRTPMTAPTIALRTAAPAEAADVRRLAYLDSQRPLRGDVLVAFEDAEPVAAISLADGRVVADPFRRTATSVELLRLRAAA